MYITSSFEVCRGQTREEVDLLVYHVTFLAVLILRMHLLLQFQ